MAACPSCGKDNPADAQFCMACGAAVGRPEARETRKVVTVLFCDVTGSTSLGERLDPETLNRVMAAYFEAMRDVIERHGGSVEKFIGDAVMAVFGVPTVHEDDALRAVRAAAEMREALGGLNEELERSHGVSIRTRTGVNTGQVLVTASTPERPMVAGDAVNVAARLEQAADPGEILIGESTYRLVRDGVVVEPVEPLTLKGKSGSVPAVRLLDVHPDAVATPRRLHAPLVGRERPLAMLEQTFEAAVTDRGCHLFTVLGTAGVGKSRLVEEFITSVGDRATVVRGHCAPYGEGVTFLPVAEAIRAAAGVSDDDAPGIVRVKLAALLAEDEHAARIVDGVAQAIGLSEEVGAPEETLWSIRRLFERIAQHAPLVIVFDDIHWAEPTFLDLIEHIADWSRDAPMLLLCLARAELLDHRPMWGGGKLNATTIHLEPLTEAEAARLIEQLLGRASLEPDVERRIAEAADGNPLFVEELISMLIDDGSLALRDGRWMPTTDLSTVPVPPSIHALLAARLDQLDPDERSVAERASIEGRVFHRGAVVELCGSEVDGHVDRHLAALLRRELIRPDRSSFSGDEAFRFRHVLIRDAAYDAIPKEVRADLHERFGAWLLQASGARVLEHEEVVGFHLEQAFRYRQELGPLGEHERELGRRAADLLDSAGKRAVTRIDLPAAAGLFGRAAALSVEAPERAERLWELGTVLNRMAEDVKAEAVLSEAIELADASGDAGLVARATLDRFFSEGVLAGPERASERQRDVRALIPALEARGDDLALTKAWQLIADGYGRQGLYESMREPLERGVFHARKAGDRLEASEALQGLSYLSWSGLTPAAEGIRRCEEVLEAVAEDRRTAAEVYAALGALHAMLGDFDQARALVARHAEILRDLGLWYGAWEAAWMRWEVERLAGDLVAAERVARFALGSLPTEGETIARADLMTILGLAACGLGRYEEAVTYVEQSERLGVSQVFSTIARCGAGARALAHLGDLDRGLALAEQGVALAETTETLDLKGLALTAHADVVVLARGPGDAVPILERALDLFERKGNVVSVARTQTWLSQLAR
ncbi:MAG TPA: adenylate/guanylate cyclase domain-containing protein [Actinomycetota bacterium]|nr:adenylate/guanylate cyclase domain-containing protein [Actinomycetota bacterium]